MVGRIDLRSAVYNVGLGTPITLRNHSVSTIYNDMSKVHSENSIIIGSA